MLTSVKDIFLNYIKENLWLFLITGILFMMGIIVGGIVVNRIPECELSELGSYLNNFFELVEDEQYFRNSYEIFYSSISYHLTLLGIIWLLGITMIGIPAVFMIVFLRGAALGFTLGLLVEEIAVKGMLFAVVSILPHNLLFLPCFFMTSVAGISFSILLIKNQFKKKSIVLLPEFLNYTLLFVIMGIGMLFSSLVEAYISPTFLQVLLQYI